MRRMQESRRSGTILGVPPDRLYFLGYPDRGILPIITDNYITPYRSKFTDASAVPYAGALSPGHAYTGLNLEHDSKLCSSAYIRRSSWPEPARLASGPPCDGIVAIRAIGTPQ